MLLNNLVFLCDDVVSVFKQSLCINYTTEYLIENKKYMNQVKLRIGKLNGKYINVVSNIKYYHK